MYTENFYINKKKRNEKKRKEKKGTLVKVVLKRMLFELVVSTTFCAMLGESLKCI